MSEVAEGPLIQVIGRPGSGGVAERRDRLGDEADDLVVADDAEVIVGQEREGPPPLAGAAVEDDRPRLGDPEAQPVRTPSPASSCSFESRGRGAASTPRAASRRAGRPGRRAWTPRAAQAEAMAAGRSAGATRRTVGLVLGDAVDELFDLLMASRSTRRR